MNYPIGPGALLRCCRLDDWVGDLRLRGTLLRSTGDMLAVPISNIARSCNSQPEFCSHHIEYDGPLQLLV